ncbi:MAG: threonine synthase [Actinomycetota bacterium]
MGSVLGLRCRECSREYPAEALHVCEFCFAPLEVVYDYEAIAAEISPASIAAGPRSMWRYAPLLPGGEDRVDLGAGMTPLVRAPRLGAELGLKDLWLKNDTANPTHSFKDRVVSVALTVAKGFGYTTVACASTGNLANAVAAHAAAAGLEAYVFIPADLESGKVVATAIYAPNLIAVKGTYDDVNRLCSEIAGEFEWAFVNVNIRPYYAEGSKSLAFEIAEQLGWQAPDHVVVPMASGSLLTKIKRGLDELVRVGLLDGHTTRISGAQATGCSPITTAFKSGTDHVRPVKPKTIAKSLAIGNPADGFYAVKASRDTGGAMEDVSDEEVVDGIRLLARTEGIFAETAGGVVIATLKRLCEQGAVRPDERTVALITGDGLKTIEAVVERATPTMVIPPRLEEFQTQLDLLSAGADA